MRTKSRLTALVAAPLVVVGLIIPASTAGAFTYVTDAEGTAWGIHSAAPPAVDTGSIRATQSGTGVQAPYSTMLNGYGGIRVRVDAAEKHRFDGELLRGFGLTEGGEGQLETTRSVDLNGVLVSRAVHVETGATFGRWLDTFTNTTDGTLTVEAAFGGQTGYGSTGTNASRVVATSSGDAEVTTQDSWTASASGTNEARTTGGPTATVVGQFDRTGNWLRDTFTQPMGTRGMPPTSPPTSTPSRSPRARAPRCCASSSSGSR